MTNREWFNSLSDKELAEFLCSDEYKNILYSYSNTVLGLEEWFKQERSCNLYEILRP